MSLGLVLAAAVSIHVASTLHISAGNSFSSGARTARPDVGPRSSPSVPPQCASGHSPPSQTSVQSSVTNAFIDPGGTFDERQAGSHVSGVQDAAIASANRPANDLGVGLNPLPALSRDFPLAQTKGSVRSDTQVPGHGNLAHQGGEPIGLECGASSVQAAIRDQKNDTSSTVHSCLACDRSR